MPDANPGPIVHDAEYYILLHRHGGAWAAEHGDLGARLAALPLQGDTNGRREYNFVCTGDIQATSTKGRYKWVWVGDHPGRPGAATDPTLTDSTRRNTVRPRRWRA